MGQVNGESVRMKINVMFTEHKLSYYSLQQVTEPLSVNNKQMIGNY